MTCKGVLLCLSRDNVRMTKQHTGDGEAEILCAESIWETGQNPELSANELNSGESEQDGPELAEAHEGEMECSLPAPTPLNTVTSDLYSEWKHRVSAFKIYSIFRSLQERGWCPESNTATLPWPDSTVHFQQASRLTCVLCKSENRPSWLLRSKALLWKLNIDSILACILYFTFPNLVARPLWRARIVNFEQNYRDKIKFSIYLSI